MTVSTVLRVRCMGLIRWGVVVVAAAVLVPICLPGAHGRALADGAPIVYTLPAGWTQSDEQAAVAAATSPDQSIRIIVRYFPLPSPMTAMQVIQKQKTKVKHDRVVTPPTDMSQLKARFNADSVAKMQLSGVTTEGGKFLYRAFAFVKGRNLAVIEAIVNTKAGEAVFKQADGTVNSFRFK